MTTAVKEEALSSRLTSKAVWNELTHASFCVVSYATPSGDPRSSGVMYKLIGRRMYIVTAANSWKARHIGTGGRVAVTVPVRRGGVLSLVAPIPPATISFAGTAVVHGAGSPRFPQLVRQLQAFVPETEASSVAVIEVTPRGRFVTYGVGVSLMQMRNTKAAKARVSMGGLP